MKVIELYQKFDEKIPSSLSCEWDNDGLMCCPNSEREVRRVLCSLDASAGAVEYALQNNFDVLLTHHPLIFHKLERITDENILSKKLIAAVQSNLSVMSFHTRLDAVQGGVNDRLAKLLSIENTSVFGHENEFVGRVGDLKEMPLSDFCKFVKATLSSESISYTDAGRSVRRVALLGGAGGDFIKDAFMCGADTFVTGEVGYNDMLDAAEYGINLVAAGHFFTENPVCDFFIEKLAEFDKSIYAEKYNSYTVKTL